MAAAKARGMWNDETKWHNVTSSVLAALSVGAPLRTASGRAGVPWGTFRNWLKLGRDPECPYPAVAEFVAEVDEAVSEWECRMLGVIDAAAEQGCDWRAAVAALQLRFPHRYRDVAEGDEDVTDVTAATEAAIAASARAIEQAIALWGAEDVSDAERAAESV